MREKIILKKYASRRLYDTANSSYVTLSQLADLIKSGHEVQVFDAKTREDVTAFILTQIILEEAKNKHTLLPAPLLHIIIRYGSSILQEFFETHLLQTINTYLELKKTFDEQIRMWLDVGMNYSEITKKTLSNISPLNPFSSQEFGREHKDLEKKEP
ncbi:MAG TPA: transcriptional regulator [Deltaproteobacteria bacterium]|nr:transcriptional regulator [Deltaproteobacteria bacterium]